MLEERKFQKKTIQISWKLALPVFMAVLFIIHPLFLKAQRLEPLVTSSIRHSPKKATLFSTFIPGLGQIYNGKWWKTPIIYAGAAAMVYFVDFNNKEYQKYKNAYNIKIYIAQHPLDSIDDPYPGLPIANLKSAKDRWRRWRDMNVIGLVALYALNIIDANVDAHFFDYDISNDLTLHVEPLFVSPQYLLVSRKESLPLGLTLSMRF